MQGHRSVARLYRFSNEGGCTFRLATPENNASSSVPFLPNEASLYMSNQNVRRMSEVPLKNLTFESGALYDREARTGVPRP